MTPTIAELAAHERRQSARRAHGEAFLARVEAEKGRPLCLACDTIGADRLTCPGHDETAA